MPAIATSNPDDEVRISCPKCGAEQLDLDGFGLVACPECGFCTHPSADSDAHGRMVCGICKKVVGQVRGFTHGAGI